VTGTQNNCSRALVLAGMASAPALASVFTLAAAMLAPPAAADSVDAPTQQRRLLRGTSHVAGELTDELGFPAYTYQVAHDGFARIALVTTNLPDRPHDNAGRAWRPFLRVIGNPSPRRHGDGWSTNGQPGDAEAGRGSLIVRVFAGEQLTIVVSVGQNMLHDRPEARARYTLSVTELAP
jgi:hypothetical protein